MRGGTANCTVVIADEPIGSPVSQFPNIALVFNNPSFERYGPVVRPGGLLVSTSRSMHDSTRTDIDVALVPATELATELGERASPT